jgi:uncharacterized membrane protein YphA (DoxX/SURF4 family)
LGETVTSQAAKSIAEPGIDAGLLTLRIGLGISFVVLLIVLKQSYGAEVFIHPPGRLWPLAALAIGALLVTFGFLVRIAAVLSAMGWALTLYSALHADVWYSLPVTAALYVIVFAALALTGPGRLSIDFVRSGKAEIWRDASRN